MFRVCGAEAERKPSEQMRCWCQGLFCGKGGHKLSIQFRRAFRTTIVARSRSEFEDLVRQADLYDGDAMRDQWRQRIDRSVSSRG